MPDLLISNVDGRLHARLTQWADEQGKPLPQLVCEILAAAERAHDNYDPNQDRTVRDIRRCRDGGCGLCDELEPLFAEGKSADVSSR